MVVKELIEKLQKVENKEKEIMMIVSLNYEHSLSMVVDDGVNVILSHLYVPTYVDAEKGENE